MIVWAGTKECKVPDREKLVREIYDFSVVHRANVIFNHNKT